MMGPSDFSVAPQQGQPQPMPRANMPPGHVQAPSPVMPPVHHQGMGGAPFGHRQSSGMPGQYQMPQSPARQGSFSGSMQPNPGQYSSHAPLHSPHQPQGGPPMHPSMSHHNQQMHRPSSSMNRQQHSNMGQGMAPMNQQHVMRSNSSQGTHNRQHSQQYGMPPANNAMAPTPNNNNNNNMSINWQSGKDTHSRREMIQHIVKMLKKDRHGTSESMEKLPQMAKQLEVSLYRNARSFEEYVDMNTLKRRLQQIAVEVSRKSRGQSDGRREERHHSERAPPPPQPPPQQQYQPAMRNEPGGATSPFMGGNSMGNASMGNASMGNTSMRSNGGQMVNMEDINPMASGNGGSQGYGLEMRNSSSRGTPIVNMPQQQPQQQSSSSTAGSNRQDGEWKIRIRHKQQRLLLLHHSAKCPHEDGRCSVTPHCGDMKRLWRHMEGCKDNNCRVPHCFSSRAILSHYRKCKDATCPACGPVRETVRKNRGSSRGQSSSGNSMMNEMRGISGPTSSNSANGMMSSSQDPLIGQGSFTSVSSSVASATFPNQQRPSSSLSNSHRGHPTQHANMPPPGGQSSSVSNGMQQYPSSSSRPSASAPLYHSGSNGNMSSSSSQQMFPPDQSNSDGRLPVPSTMPSSRPKEAAVPSASASSSMQSTARPAGGSSSGGGGGGSSTTSGGSGGGSSSRNDTEWQKIRHKQQRLLLLRHASRCQHEAGKCPVTPHCAGMKKLWEHIAHCKNQQCTVQHCLSSRYVLSHYRRCKDARCPACGPVRETIRKSHEREKSRQQPPSSQAFETGPIADPDIMEPGKASPQLGPTPSMPSPTESYQQEPPLKRAKHEHVQPVVAPPPPPVPEVQPSELPEMVKRKPVEKQDPKDKSKGVADHSLLSSFTIKELETHLASLDRKTQLPVATLKTKCLEVLKGLQTHQHGWVFNCPVDPVELGLPDYFEIINKPMDLGTIQKRLENGSFHMIEAFAADVNLTFDNAMTYNENGSVVYDMAKELKVKFSADMKKFMAKLESEDRVRRQNERACTLCGCEKLLFEPPVYFCNGMKCASTRIRRNSHFFIGGNNQYFWCNSCFNELDDKIPIELADMTIMKADLKKKKNDEVHEESWVQCDDCQRWVHQVCGLFNTRQNKEHHSEYRCPVCLLKKQKTTGVLDAPKPSSAADLPRTTLSEWLEEHVIKKTNAKKRQLIEDMRANKIPMDQEMVDSELSGKLYIRQVTSMERKLEVRELMKKRYAHKNYPDEFPFRCKCILVFQELDGVDVVLFALYVYEHGEDNPPPNKRVVYISYLDSVHFMRPRKLRTFVYHEVLIAYLDYARKKGFVTAHIWACPPLKGDDYIFYAKPEDQRIPRDKRLCQWYIEMLRECQVRRIVGKVTNMYDLYFANDAIDATAVPYLEGDYFPGEAENIIKMLEEGDGKKGSGGGKKKKSKSSSKNRGSTGTRSTGVDEEALLASGAFEGARSLKDLDRDPVMMKLGETIQPMKESFIVAFLACPNAKEEDMVVPEDIEKARLEWKDDANDLSGRKRDSSGVALDGNPVDRHGRAVKVIDDDTEDLDCEFLNNRQAFLNLCRGNHYQFDELRRAKHTSMMVLWHLHNRDAPKFVQQCVACNREILSGKRYHCNTCPDYDLCEDCFKDPGVNRGSCTHKLQPMAVEPDAGQERSSGLSDAERKQRQRNLMLHIQLIEHASRCNSKSCTSTNCVKMKTYLQHSRVCRVKVQGGCKICKRIWTLLRIHAQKCKDSDCPIPQCNAIREKMRQLQKQQQAMDDRRRLEMNRMRFGTAGA